MKNLIIKLSKWLKNNHLHIEAQQIQDLSQYEEPWHEEAVQEFGGESISEEEYLRQHFKVPESDLGLLNRPREEAEDIIDSDKKKLVEQILEKENFVPVRAGGKESMIGRGSFGMVYRGVYQGQPAIAKLIFEENSDYSRQNDEVNNWNKILHMVSENPRYKKYVPNIYKLNRDQIEIDGKIHKYEIVIMEELYRLNWDFRRFLAQGYEIMERNTNMLLKNEEILYEIAEGLDEKIKLFTHIFKNVPREELQRNIKDDILNIFKIMLSPPGLTTETQEEISEKIADYYLQKYDLYFSESNSSFKYLISNRLRRTIYGDLPMSYFSFWESGPYYRSSPETENIYKFLLVLAEDYGLRWTDLHEDNFMMDRDGNIKIIDVGLYKKQS